MAEWQAAAQMMVVLLIVVLAALRVREGRRQLFRATERWSRLPAHRAGMVFAALAGVMFLGLQRDEARLSSEGTVVSITNQPTEWELLGAAPSVDAVAEPDATSAAEAPDRKERALASLRDFASRVEEKRSFIDNLGSDEQAQSAQASVPDVDTMIERLRARLNNNPTDVKGWTTLGWACASTGKYQEAVEAYETALRLDARNPEIMSALEDAKSKVSDAAARSDSK